MSVNFPNWITADIMIPEFVERFFSIKVSASKVDPTQVNVEWFDDNSWLSVPPEDRRKMAMMSSEFIGHFIEDYKLLERANGFLYTPNDEVGWARLEGVISIELLRYENDNGISFKKALSRYLLDGTTFREDANRANKKMDMDDM